LIFFIGNNEILSFTDENVAGRTMAVETKLFLHKIEEMSKLVSAMKLWMPSHEPELQDIESGLSNLSNIVEKDDCLNAGGKFEWVDSVLVKVFYQTRQAFFLWKSFAGKLHLSRGRIF
jgi:hypothetical protein